MQATYREVPIADNVIRVALVQLRSPFAGPRPDLKLLDLETIGPPRFVWSDKIAIARRVAAANESLKFLKTFRPHLIAFPEYAVPKECHSHLQEYADDCDCILVPGSYYDDDTNSIRYQNNVSRIFIPRQESVYVIKHDRFGDEERVLSKERPAPNIAHLTWRSSIGSPMGVSVFICRDYLRPYDPNHTSLLDWDRPGLNLVIMHAAQTELFDAQAGLDVRRLRGKGRFVALCNCAGITNETRFRGSALLGPTKDSRRKEGDLIERLPSELEGVLTAELDLSKVQLDEIRPDKTEHDPLGTVRRYHLLQDDKHHVLFDPIGDPTPVRARSLAPGTPGSTRAKHNARTQKVSPLSRSGKHTPRPVKQQNPVCVGLGTTRRPGLRISTLRGRRRQAASIGNSLFLSATIRARPSL